MAENVKEKTRWWIRITILAMLLTLLRINDFSVEGDTLWHIKDGIRILQTHSIRDKIDSFSWYAANQGYEQLKHSWLGSIILACVYNIFKDLTITSIVFGEAVLLITMLVIVKYYQSELKIKHVGLLVMAFTPILLKMADTVRPRSISFILFAWLIGELDHIDKNKISIPQLIRVAIISVLWSNIHGSTVLYIPIYSITYSICSLVKIKQGNIDNTEYTKEYRLNLILITITSIVLGLYNIYGVELYKYPFTGNSEICKRYVTEWNPATLVSNKSTFIMLIVAIIVITISNKKYKVEDSIAFGSMLIATLKYNRFEPYLAIAFTIFIIKHLRDVDKQLQKHSLADRLNKIAIGITTITSIITVALLIININHFQTELNKEIESKLPSDVIEYLREVKPERLYNQYNEGAYLIWNDINSFVDSRADLFDDNAIRISKEPELKNNINNNIEEISKYNFDCILVKKNSILTFELENIERLKPTYISKDDSYYIFKINK